MPLPSVAVSLDDVLITKQLTLRRPRSPSYQLENRALLSLAEEMARNPSAILQRVSELAMELCHADSAGISVIEPGGERDQFRWRAAAGPLSILLGDTIPHHASPCGTVLAQNRVLLFNRPERFFPALQGIAPPILEALLAPWAVRGEVVGTLWVVAQRSDRRFDQEDARLLEDLSRFASAAYSLTERARAAEDLRTQRRAALNLMEDAVESRAALSRSEERLRLIIENARDYAIFATDQDRRVTSWNTGAQRILGYTDAEIVGQSADVIFTSEDRRAGVCEREAQIALTESRAFDERWHVRKDGTRFWASGVMMPMHGTGGEMLGFVKIFRDQTDAKRIQEALSQSRAELEAALRTAEAARQEAEAANRTKDLFLATLSHELRTPLTPILMATETLLRRKDLPPRVHEALEMISRNAQIETRFVDDLLDQTRFARGKLELTRGRLDLHEVVRRAAEVAEADIQAKEQHLALELEAAAAEMEGDFLRLQQTFWNLMKNASKFTPVGGPIRVRSHNESEDWVVVEVIDTGRGIDPAALPHIFEAFSQGDESTAREFGGLGLGLAIAKATVVAHGGAISASSPGRDQGSTFTIKLPVQSSLPRAHE